MLDTSDVDHENLFRYPELGDAVADGTARALELLSQNPETSAAGLGDPKLTEPFARELTAEPVALGLE